MEEIVHLRDIDEMWDSLSNIHNSLTTIYDDLNSIRNDAIKQQSDIDSFLMFMNRLSSYKHLKDVDKIWSTTEFHSDRLDSMEKQGGDTLELVHMNQVYIDRLLEYKERLCGITHLNDVDELWDSNLSHSTQLSELENQVEKTKNLIQDNKKLMDMNLAEVVEKNDMVVQMLTKKIKYAYLFAGGSLGLALIELIVIFFKVM